LLAKKFSGVQLQKEELQQSLIRERNISDDLLKNVAVLVKEAGVRDCNGLYKFKCLKNNAGVFERSGLSRGVLSRSVIHKVLIPPNTAYWFMSILPQQSELTDCSTMCWYKSEASLKDSLPNNNWTHGMACRLFMPPRVTVRFVDLFDGENEGETISVVSSSVNVVWEEEEEKEKEEVV
jgi:hypothetical protein